jgi:hypothetical protein
MTDQYNNQIFVLFCVVHHLKESKKRNIGWLESIGCKAALPNESLFASQHVLQVYNSVVCLGHIMCLAAAVCVYGLSVPFVEGSDV